MKSIPEEILTIIQTDLNDLADSQKTKDQICKTLKSMAFGIGMIRAEYFPTEKK